MTPALLAAVRNDVQGLQKESTSAPDQAAVTTLSKDLAALNGATPDFTQGQLQTDLEAVIKSTGASDATLVTTLEHDLNAVAAAMNVTPADVQTIEADQKAIAGDGGPSAGGTSTARLPLKRRPPRRAGRRRAGDTVRLPRRHPRSCPARARRSAVRRGSNHRPAEHPGRASSSIWPEPSPVTCLRRDARQARHAAEA